jgi:hypothetical protein
METGCCRPRMSGYRAATCCWEPLVGAPPQPPREPIGQCWPSILPTATVLRLLQRYLTQAVEVEGRAEQQALAGVNRPLMRGARAQLSAREQSPFRFQRPRPARSGQKLANEQKWIGGQDRRHHNMFRTTARSAGACPVSPPWLHGDARTRLYCNSPPAPHVRLKERNDWAIYSLPLPRMYCNVSFRLVQILLWLSGSGPTFLTA